MSGNRRERRAADRGASVPSGRPTAAASRYGTSIRRDALAPGLLGAIVLLAGLALFGSTWFVLVLYAVSILALILIVFAVQARHWWWVPVLAAIAVLWNPVVPLPFSGRWWVVAQLVAGAAFAVAGVLIRRPDPDSHAG